MNAELFNTALLEKMYVCRELIFLNSTSLPHIGTLRCVALPFVALNVCPSK